MNAVACPHCQRGVAYNPSLAGQAVSCPHCSRAFQMPVLRARVPRAQPVSTQPEPQGSRHDVGDDFVVNTEARFDRHAARPRSRSSSNTALGAVVICAIVLAIGLIAVFFSGELSGGRTWYGIGYERGSARGRYDRNHANTPNATFTPPFGDFIKRASTMGAEEYQREMSSMSNDQLRAAAIIREVLQEEQGFPEPGTPEFGDFARGYEEGYISGYY